MSKLYFYYSVMDSGKSAHIIMQVHNLRKKGKNVFVIKPKLDTRDYGIIKSRALDTELNAFLIDKDFELFDYVNEVGAIDYIFVDEVNFLSNENIEALADIVDYLDIPVFGYGLMNDYMTHLFEGSKRMVELADSVRELKSPCDKCGNKATLHLRKVNGRYQFEGEAIQVGDMEYESVCRKCYKEAELEHFV